MKKILFIASLFIAYTAKAQTTNTNINFGFSITETETETQPVQNNTNITIIEHHTPPPTTVIIETPPATPSYSGKKGCYNPIYDPEFNQILSSVESKDFENTKITQAKQIIQNKCLTAVQVKRLLGAFDFENSKLEIAKYAYKYTFDQDNYYLVNDAFEFENSIADLNNYINNR